MGSKPSQEIFININMYQSNISHKINKNMYSMSILIDWVFNYTYCRSSLNWLVLEYEFVHNSWDFFNQFLCAIISTSYCNSAEVVDINFSVTESISDSSVIFKAKK